MTIPAILATVSTVITIILGIITLVEKIRGGKISIPNETNAETKPKSIQSYSSTSSQDYSELPDGIVTAKILFIANWLFISPFITLLALALAPWRNSTYSWFLWSSLMAVLWGIFLLLSFFLGGASRQAWSSKYSVYPIISIIGILIFVIIAVSIWYSLFP